MEMEEGGIVDPVPVPFPEDVLFDILIRLPVRFVRRIRHVSTLWRSITSSGDFVTSFFARSLSYPKVLVAIPYDCVPGPNFNAVRRVIYAQLDYDDDDEEDKDISRLEPYSTTPSAHAPKSVAGLVCLEHHRPHYHVQICNPSTGHRVQLPSTGASPCGLGVEDERWTLLCFDPATRHHKVVESTVHRPTKATQNRVLTILEGGKVDTWTWRRLTDAPLHEIYGLCGQLCINGILYYIGRDKGRFFVVAFHVHSETFHMIPVDDNLPVLGTRLMMRLVEFDGARIALVHCPVFESESRRQGWRNIDRVRLWVLEDVHNQVWSSIAVDLPPRETLPRYGEFSLVGSIHSGGVLVFIWTLHSSSFYFFYDVKKNSFRKSQIHIPISSALDYPIYSFFMPEMEVSDHSESLLPLC